MTSVTLETVIAAERSIVFETVADRERSGEYLPLQTRLDRPGEQARQGVGAVHFLGFGPVGVREEITELVPDTRLAYRVVSGLPVRSHHGVIEFADHPDGTLVTYTMESDPKVPLPDGLLRLILARMIRTMVDGAASAVS